MIVAAGGGGDIGGLALAVTSVGGGAIGGLTLLVGAPGGGVGGLTLLVGAPGGGMGGRKPDAGRGRGVAGRTRFGTLPPCGATRGGNVIRTVSFFGPS